MAKVNAIYGAAVETKYLGPTNTKGGRLLIKPLGGKRGVTVPYDHALSVTDNHERAAAAALGSNKLTCAETKKGFIFVQRK